MSFIQTITNLCQRGWEKDMLGSVFRTPLFRFFIQRFGALLLSRMVGTCFGYAPKIQKNGFLS